ncbi:MAG: peptidylprolyl isomerase [Syntrophus sp. (in: bacteria)]|nr:peptidylprolyl isomerase [Syntrophus sp. (in: bacteria)]
MKKLCILLCTVLLFCACSKKQDGKVLATIDDDKITTEEFSKALDKIPMNMKMVVATESGKKNYLDNMIMKRLILREAKKEKIDSDKDFLERLDEIKDQLLMETLLKKKLSMDGKLTDEDLKKYYDAHKEEFKKDGEINTRHVLVKTEEEAKQIQAKIQKGDDFSDLAKKYSIDPNAKTTGGDIGFHPKGTLLPEYEAAAFKLKKVGQISGIVKTQFGYHIIRLEGAKPATYVAFEEVKDFIKQKIGQEKQKELFDKYVSDLKKAAKITINEQLLKPEEKAEKKIGPSDKPEAKPEAKPEKPVVKDEGKPKK